MFVALIVANMEWGTFYPGGEQDSYAAGAHAFGHAPQGHGSTEAGASWSLLGNNKVPPYWGATSSL